MPAAVTLSWLKELKLIGCLPARTARSGIGDTAPMAVPERGQEGMGAAPLLPLAAAP
jgi:hypothetical protein